MYTKKNYGARTFKGVAVIFACTSDTNYGGRRGPLSRIIISKWVQFIWRTSNLKIIKGEDDNTKKKTRNQITKQPKCEQKIITTATIFVSKR